MLYISISNIKIIIYMSLHYILLSLLLICKLNCKFYGENNNNNNNQYNFIIIITIIIIILIFWNIILLKLSWIVLVTINSFDWWLNTKLFKII